LTARRASDTIPHVKLYFAIFGASIVAAAACGARTGLDVPIPPEHEQDAGPDVLDAGPDVFDAPPDVFDAPPDVFDAPPDAPVVNDCQDAGTTYIYVITEQNDLYSYYPPNGAFSYIGTIACPTTVPDDTPFSMAVDRTGTAYVVFQSGDLFKVSTADASCNSTPYMHMPFGEGETFGMGYSADLTDPGETLYVASDDAKVNGLPTVPEFLGSIDTTAFKLDVVGQFPKVIGSAELTGTGDGRLFGFGVLQNSSVLASPVSISVVEIDKAAPQNLLSQTPVTLAASGTTQLTAWAFAFWGGDFYFFTAAGGAMTSTVSLYHPGGSTVAMPILTLPNTIVGAGVSTCAPQQ
jgi:hypothetical protein